MEGFFFLPKIQGWTPRDRTMHVVRITIRKTGQSPRTEWSGNWLQDMGVSSLLIGFSIINHPFWGTPIFGNSHMFYPQKKLWLQKSCFFFVSIDDRKRAVRKRFSSTSWRIIPVSKWVITMVIVSPLTVVVPLPNGLNGL